MTSSLKQWQASIFFDPEDQKVVIYGDSLVTLRTQARSYLEEHKPLCFGNGMVTYLYSDGSYPKQPRNFIDDDPLPEDMPHVLKQGWWREDEPRQHGQEVLSFRVASFESAVNAFLEKTMLPEKGPGYHAQVGEDGMLPLDEALTVREETDEAAVRQYIERGWHILGLSFEGNEEQNGDEPHHRPQVFLLGHPEENAL